VFATEWSNEALVIVGPNELGGATHLGFENCGEVILYSLDINGLGGDTTMIGIENCRSFTAIDCNFYNTHGDIFHVLGASQLTEFKLISCEIYDVTQSDGFHPDVIQYYPPEISGSFIMRDCHIHGTDHQLTSTFQVSTAEMSGNLFNSCGTFYISVYDGGYFQHNTFLPQLSLTADSATIQMLDNVGAQVYLAGSAGDYTITGNVFDMAWNTPISPSAATNKIVGTYDNLKALLDWGGDYTLLDTSIWEAGYNFYDFTDPNIPPVQEPEESEYEIEYLFDNNDLLDTSSYSNHGTLIGAGDPCYVTGYDSNGIYLDGSHAIEANEFDDVSGLTLMAWVKVDEGGYGTLFWEGDTADWSDLKLEILSDYSIIFRVKSQTSSTNLTTVAGIIDVNEWHHIAAACSDTYQVIYIDGNSVASKSGSFTHNGGHYNLQIGRIYDGVNAAESYLTGTLDSVRVYSHYLTQEEIVQDDPNVSVAFYYYIDATDGNDTTGTGSNLSPWKTLAKAYAEIPDGNTLNLEPGTYAGTTFDRPVGITITGNAVYASQTYIAGDVVLGPNTAGKTYAFENLTITDGGDAEEYPFTVQFSDNQYAELTFTNCVFSSTLANVLYGDADNPLAISLGDDPSFEYRPDSLDANDIRAGKTINGLAGLLDLPDVNDVRYGTAFDNTTKTGTLEVTAGVTDRSRW
jgi:hypothetical protein